MSLNNECKVSVVAPENLMEIYRGCWRVGWQAVCTVWSRLLDQPQPEATLPRAHKIHQK